MIELWGSFLSIFCSVLVMWAHLLIWDSFFIRKLQGKKFRAFVVCVYLPLTVLVTMIGPPTGLWMLYEIAEGVATGLIAYHIRWDRCFFISATMCAIGYSFSYWSDRFLMAIFALSYEEYIWNIPLYSVSILGRAILFVLLAMLTKRLHRPLAVYGSPSIWLSLSCVFPLLTLLILLKASVPAPEQPVWQISLAVLDLVNVVALFLFDYMERTSMEREQLIAASERARVQDENIGALSAAYGAQRKMTHDFRAHLAALANLLERDNIEEARRYLAEIRMRTTERILLVNSHNAAIDAVLNQKGYAGQKKGIDMRFRVYDLSPLHIPSADITVVLGNLLDNAIEACAGFPEEERWVDVRLFYHGEEEPPLLSLIVTNPSKPVKIVDGSIATSKKDTMLHGFGLRNVQDILKQYDAEHMILCENGRFIFQCSWPDRK